jgi:hypothetical protein
LLRRDPPCIGEEQIEPKRVERERDIGAAFGFGRA